MLARYDDVYNLAITFHILSFNFYVKKSLAESVQTDPLPIRWGFLHMEIQWDRIAQTRILCIATVRPHLCVVVIFGLPIPCIYLTWSTMV